MSYNSRIMTLKRRILPLTLALSLVTIIYGAKLGLELAGVKLLINITDSAPHGVYGVIQPVDLQRGDFIVFELPESVRNEVQNRPWLKKVAPLLKPVAGLPSEKVCITEDSVSVADRPLGPVFQSDYLGLPLPKLRGCFTIKAGEVFPLSSYSERSFDGRYFGPLYRGDLIGEAFPLLTW